MAEPRASRPGGVARRAPLALGGALALAVWSAACVADLDVPICRLGTADCGGRCVELDTDPLHCGLCNLPCAAGQACLAGRCHAPCGFGLALCGDDCVSLATHPLHCGDCDTACSPDEACSEGSCQRDCLGGSISCGGQCVDTASDTLHCGDCDHACPEGRACVAGSCQPYAACEHRWSSSLGETSNQRAMSVALVQDRAIVAFEYAGELPLGCLTDTSVGGSDIALASIGTNGDITCLAQFGGAGNEIVGGVAVAPTGEFVLVGSFSGTLTLGGLPPATASGQDGFVVKLDATGQVLWAAFVGGGSNASDAITSVAVGSDGAIVIGGSLGATATLVDSMGTATPFDPHQGGSDAFVARLYDDGTVDWVRSFGDSMDDRLRDVAVRPSGSLIIAGSFSRDVMIADDPHAVLPIDPNDPLEHRAQEAGFVAELDAAGKAVWSKAFASRELSDSRDARFVALALDADDGVWVFGEFNAKSAIGNKTLVGNATTLDAALVHLDPAGASLGAWVLGGDGVDGAVDIAVSGGFLVMTGYFSVELLLSPLGGPKLSSTGNRDVFTIVSELPETPAGAPTIDCALAFGDPALQQPQAITAGNTDLWLVGLHQGEIDLGGGPHANKGGQDAFVARLGL
jgi:outer membrane protein assembly factor BamB